MEITCNSKVIDGRELVYPVAHVAEADRMFSGQEYQQIVLPGSDDLMKTIVDVGANVGLFSAYMRLSYPKAVIHAVEPSPVSHELLRKNGKAFDFYVHEFAAADYEMGVADLYIGNNKGLEDSLIKTPCSSNHKTHVTIKQISKQKWEPIDVLKVDTEGFEVEVLRDCLSGHKPYVLYIEYHSETDRLTITEMLGKDYLLVSSYSPQPHRGTLTYLLSSYANTFAEIMAIDTRRFR